MNSKLLECWCSWFQRFTRSRRTRNRIRFIRIGGDLWEVPHGWFYRDGVFLTYGIPTDRPRTSEAHINCRCSISPRLDAALRAALH